MSTKAELEALALEGKDAPARLASLEEKLSRDRAAGFIPPKTDEVNNHIHTIYSFSPYSPAEAAYGAWRAGLEAVGIVDHESVSGCEEMREAGKRIGIAVTSGCELRVDAAGTPLEGRRINNPDSPGLFYMVIHGIPRQALGRLDAYLTKIRASRNVRMRRQVNTLNDILLAADLPELEFDRDVVPISRSIEGGSITERHILYALALKMEETYGRGRPLINCIKSSLGLAVPSGIEGRLTDGGNPHFLYDLLGLLKESLVPQFYLQPNSAECPPVSDVIALAERVGGIACYCYLGKSGNSPLGEDDWLDILFDALPELGFQALAYMPPRNTKEQLERVKRKCREKEMMEISGVDINSSRQMFRCPEVAAPEFIHLHDRTWALIAHENFTSNGGFGLFDPASPLAGTPLGNRLDVYARMGRRMNPFQPETIVDEARKEGLWTVSH